MTYQEKRVLLRNDPTAQKLWYANLVVFAISFFIGLFLTIRAVSITAGEASQTFVVTTLMLGLLLVILYFFGVLRLVRWIWIVSWIGLGINILTFNIFQIIYSIFFLWSYRRVLKAVSGTSHPIPPAS